MRATAKLLGRELEARKAGEVWHARSIVESLEGLESRADGLAESDARERLAKHGPNEQPAPKRRALLGIIAGQLVDPIQGVLAASAVVAFAMGDTADAGVVAALIAINVIVGAIQEARAERAVASLRKLLVLDAVAVREGKTRTLLARELVPGDVVEIEAGAKVPADLRLLEAQGLSVDESPLTGESVPLAKHTDALAMETPLAERTNLAFAGTLVTQGRGRGVVFATGARTEVGRIAHLMESGEVLETPLVIRLKKFGRVVSVAVIVVSALTVLAGWLLGRGPIGPMLLAGVSIAVAAIPEGLPVVVTVALAIGVRRMAARNAIVRRLPVVEALGSATIIGTDKTGTLTENRMTVARIVPVEEERELLEAALLVNDASGTIGDPVDVALKDEAKKRGVTEGPKRIAAIPFEPRQRLMATLHEGNKLLVKGALERLLPLCKIEDGVRDRITAEADRMASSGERVLAFARGRREGPLDIASVERGELTLLGLAGLIDPPREGVKEAILACRKAGISVKVLTGDHPGTAAAIARMVGLEVRDDQVVTGMQLERATPEERGELIRNAVVLARVVPEDKLAIVEALQARGEIVAMTGDGVNDAPALRRADVGVAMGKRGTEVAKDAAPLVLADDEFGSIVAAVEEGRNVYENIRNAVQFTLATSVGQAVLVAAAVLAGLPLPLTPIQVLWVNLVVAVALAVPLGFERWSKLLDVPPRSPREPLVTGRVLRRVIGMSTTMALLAFAAFALHDREFPHEPVDRTRAFVLTVVMLAQVSFLLCLRREGQAKGSGPVLVGLGVTAVLHLVLLHVPVFQKLFAVAPISWKEWLVAAAAGLLVFPGFVVDLMIGRAWARMLRERS